MVEFWSQNSPNWTVWCGGLTLLTVVVVRAVYRILKCDVLYLPTSGLGFPISCEFDWIFWLDKLLFRRRNVIMLNILKFLNMFLAEDVFGVRLKGPIPKYNPHSINLASHHIHQLLLHVIDFKLANPTLYLYTICFLWSGRLSKPGFFCTNRANRLTKQMTDAATSPILLSRDKIVFDKKKLKCKVTMHSNVVPFTKTDRMQTRNVSRSLRMLNFLVLNI